MMSNKIKINKKLNFDIDKRPLLIAEISGNHNGSKVQFLNHIKTAHRCGADLIKIQTYEPDDITLNSKQKEFLIKSGIWKGKNLWNLYQKAQTPYSWHKDAFRLAKKLGATLFSSPFSPKGVDFLEKINVPLYKLASLEITDLNLIKKIAQTRKPVIISTGSATNKEISTCIKIIKKFHKKIIILHCISDYPTLNKNSNVKKILFLKKHFKNKFIGLSDHTNDIYSSIAATAMNVVAIEKHFKISNKIKSADSSFSITPKKFIELKRFITNVHESLTTTKKNEFDKSNFRRSIFTAKLIKKGEKFTEKNIVSLRPLIGICSSNYFRILNKKSNINILKNKPIFERNIK